MIGKDSILISPRWLIVALVVGILLGLLATRVMLTDTRNELCIEQFSHAATTIDSLVVVTNGRNCLDVLRREFRDLP